jgi:hypothetical protein
VWLAEPVRGGSIGNADRPPNWPPCDQQGSGSPLSLSRVRSTLVSVRQPPSVLGALSS